MAVVFAAACSLIGASAAPAAWHQPVGGASPINHAGDHDAYKPSLIGVAGVPYVGWEEHAGNPAKQAHVASLGGGGTSWDEAGPPPAYSASQQAAAVSMTAIGSTPWVTWAESDGTNFEIRVASFDGSAWPEPGKDVSSTSGGINYSTTRIAQSPSLSAVGSVPYVAWLEYDAANTAEVRVARLHKGTSLPQTYWEEPWTDVNASSGGINQATDQSAVSPVLATIAGVPYVAWTEYDGDNYELRIARLNGATWEQPWTGVSTTMGRVNQSAIQNAQDADLASVGGVPYVAWTEFDGSQWELRVARLNGSAWEQPWIGVSGSYGGIMHSSSQSAYEPSVASIGGVPYVAWAEGPSPAQLRVARLNTASNQWEEVWTGVTASYGGITDSPIGSTISTSLADIGGVPYVAWTETPNGGGHAQLRVSRLEPEFQTQSAGASADGATLAAGVRTYGLPYAIGFQYGVNALDRETSADPVPAGQDDVSVSREVTGLTPGSSHQFRPFATAAYGARVLGATGIFTTLAGPTLGGAGGGGGGAQADTSSPIVSALTASPRRFAVDPTGRSETAVTAKARPRKGTTFSYSLTEPGRALFTLERTLPGRRVGRACRKPSRANRRRRTCVRYVLAGRFAQQGVAGGNRKRFSGRIGRRRLAPGAYRATIVAQDAAGNRSKPTRVSFTVVRG